MEEKQNKIENVWGKVLKNSDDRSNLLKQITYPIPLVSKFTDTNNLKMNIFDSSNNINIHECTLAFERKEYFINNIYLNILVQLKDDTLLNNNKNHKIFNELKSNDTLSNAVADEYNNLVLDYNRYISFFPNFVFAKQNGFSKKKYFNIKYGIQNQDPNLHAKELPEWAKNIDTL
jgi:hypothetical protein